MFFRIYANTYIDTKKNENHENELNISFIYEIEDDELFAEVKYKHIELIKERGDIVEGMNINIPYYINNKSFELNRVDICIEYTNIELCSSSDCDDFSELDDIEDNEIFKFVKYDDSFNTELINEIKDVELLYEYDTHYDCYCKTQKVCGCGCDPLHDGW
jgi:hypothetical protein